jgi:hypothetical protein
MFLEEDADSSSLQNTGTYPLNYRESYLQRPLTVSARFISAADLLWQQHLQVAYVTPVLKHETEQWQDTDNKDSPWRKETRLESWNL